MCLNIILKHWSANVKKLIMKITTKCSQNYWTICQTKTFAGYAEKRKMSSLALTFQEHNTIAKSLGENKPDGLWRKFHQIIAFELAWRSKEAVKCLIEYLVKKFKIWQERQEEKTRVSLFICTCWPSKSIYTCWPSKS